ncbi:MAG: hypothetical protein ACOC58_04100 [Chloroflexota bacterium]
MMDEGDSGLERRPEILYGSPGTGIYRDNRLILWIPDDFDSLTRNLPRKELEALYQELKRYFER